VLPRPTLSTNFRFSAQVSWRWCTAAGWQPWLDTVTGWLREGRSPAVFIHTPGNAGALGLARQFHDEVQARVPGAGPLPEPVPVGPHTLF
jgi:hypothetical protein